MRVAIAGVVLGGVVLGAMGCGGEDEKKCCEVKSGSYRIESGEEFGDQCGIDPNSSFGDTVTVTVSESTLTIDWGGSTTPLDETEENVWAESFNENVDFSPTFDCIALATEADEVIGIGNNEFSLFADFSVTAVSGAECASANVPCQSSWMWSFEKQ